MHFSSGTPGLCCIFTLNAECNILCLVDWLFGYLVGQIFGCLMLYVVESTPADIYSSPSVLNNCVNKKAISCEDMKMFASI